MPRGCPTSEDGLREIPGNHGGRVGEIELGPSSLAVLGALFPADFANWFLNQTAAVALLNTLDSSHVKQLSWPYTLLCGNGKLLCSGNDLMT